MAETFDIGSQVPLGVTISDSNGNNANATTVVATITLPDGTTATPSVTNSATGLYDAVYTPSQTGRHIVAWLATGSNASSYYDEFTVRDYTQLSIISLDEAKDHLNIALTTTTSDNELRRMIDAATSLAQSYTGNILGRVTYTNEIYDGNVDNIRLQHPRAMSITSVYENGTLLTSADYSLEYTGQRLWRVTAGSLNEPNYFGIWAPGAQNITISYVSGFVNPDPAAKQGVLEIVRHLWQTQRGSMNVISRNQNGDDFYSGATYSLPRRAMELLDPISLPGIL
jgi:hypothetical protein